MQSTKLYKTIRLEENLHRRTKSVAANLGFSLQNLIDDLISKGLTEVEGEEELWKKK